MKKKISLICIVCIILFNVCGCQNQEIQNPNDITNDNIEQNDTNKTPKEKIMDYYSESHDAICTEQKCIYNFTFYGTITKYTIDFQNKKYYIETNMSTGTMYEEYNYGNNSAYLKNISNVGWTTTTEIKGNFNNEKFNWNCSSDLPGACENMGQDYADKLIELKEDLEKVCNNLNIDIKDKHCYNIV